MTGSSRSRLSLAGLLGLLGLAWGMPIPPDPRTRVDRKLNNLEARLNRLERGSARSYHYSDGTRDRVIIGLQANGKYGLRIIDSAGTTQVTNEF